MRRAGIARQGAREARADEAGREPGELPTWVWVAGLLATGVFCTAVLSPLLGMKVYEPIAAIVLALLVAVLAVRALGETDLVRYLFSPQQLMMPRSLCASLV